MPNNGLSFQTNRALLESGLGERPSTQTQQPSVGVGGTGASAAETQAKALGISLEQLRQRQIEQFKELMRKRQGFAEGGVVPETTMPWQNEKRRQRGEHMDELAGPTKKAQDVLGALKSFVVGDTPGEMAFNAMTMGAWPLKAARPVLGGLAALSASDDANAGWLSKLKAVYDQPRSISRMLRGDSLEAVTTPPAKLRKIENMSDDFFKQMKDASAAQDAHYAKLRAKHPMNTPQPADILTTLNEGANAGHQVYEVTEPARGWTTINPETGYIGGLLSEGSGPSITNATFNALAREHKGLVDATAATSELAKLYGDKGLTVNPGTWKIKLAEGGLVENDDDFAYPGFF